MNHPRNIASVLQPPVRPLASAAAALLALVLVAGCDLRLPGTGIRSTDMRVLQAVVKPACEFEWPQIVSDLPAEPLRDASLGAQKPMVQFGLDVAARERPPKARWPRGTLCKSVRVVSNSAIEHALQLETSDPPSWNHFRTRFPGTRTLVRVSLPVYSKDGRRAVVYTESTCPFRCGNGFYHELVRETSRWRIVRSVNVWAL